MNTIDTLDYTPFLSTIKPPTFWIRVCSWWSNDTNGRGSEPSSDPATYSPCNPEERLDIYRNLLEDARTIYVFRNGTAVFSTEAMSEVEAANIMKEHGRVRPGTSAADFHVASIESRISGFAVRYSHPQIVSFGGSTDFPPTLPKPIAGSMIRLSRDMDSYDLHMVAHYAD